MKLMLTMLLILLLGTSIDNPYFEGMVKNLSPELQLNKTNNTDTEAPFLDLHLKFLLQIDPFLLKFMINAMT